MILSLFFFLYKMELYKRTHTWKTQQHTKRGSRSRSIPFTLIGKNSRHAVYKCSDRPPRVLLQYSNVYKWIYKCAYKKRRRKEIFNMAASSQEGFAAVAQGLDVLYNCTSGPVAPSSWSTSYRISQETWSNPFSRSTKHMQTVWANFPSNYLKRVNIKRINNWSNSFSQIHQLGIKLQWPLPLTAARSPLNKLIETQGKNKGERVRFHLGFEDCSWGRWGKFRREAIPKFRKCDWFALWVEFKKGIKDDTKIVVFSKI